MTPAHGTFCHGKGALWASHKGTSSIHEFEAFLTKSPSKSPICKYCHFVVKFNIWMGGGHKHSNHSKSTQEVRNISFTMSHTEEKKYGRIKRFFSSYLSFTFKLDSCDFQILLKLSLTLTQTQTIYNCSKSAWKLKEYPVETKVRWKGPRAWVLTEMHRRSNLSSQNQQISNIRVQGLQM